MKFKILGTKTKDNILSSSMSVSLFASVSPIISPLAFGVIMSPNKLTSDIDGNL